LIKYRVNYQISNEGNVNIKVWPLALHCLEELGSDECD